VSVETGIVSVFTQTGAGALSLEAAAADLGVLAARTARVLDVAAEVGVCPPTEHAARACSAATAAWRRTREAWSFSGEGTDADREQVAAGRELHGLLTGLLRDGPT